MGREGVGAGGEMTQALYAHMNKKKETSCDKFSKMKKKIKIKK
jgi:hypothetical protein